MVNGIKWKYKYDKYNQLIYAKAINNGEKLIPESAESSEWCSSCSNGLAV